MSVCCLTSMYMGFLWSNDFLAEKVNAFPTAAMTNRAYKIKAKAHYSLETEFGFVTQMTDLVVLKPEALHLNIERLSIYYPSTAGKVFTPGQDAIFWMMLKERADPKPVPSVFSDWTEHFERHFSGSIKDLRLVESKMSAWKQNASLSAANRELIGFFLHGEPAYEWSQRLSPYGVGHLLSVSGLHCGLFYFFIKFCLVFLRRPIWRSLIITLSLASFASWMGWTSSVTRATIMLIIWEVLPLFNIRRNWISIWWSLLLGLLLLQPDLLLRKGIWYTFTASLGLIAGYRSPGRPEHPWLTKIRWVLPIFSAQICVIPLNLMFSGTSFPLSILWNLFGVGFLVILFFLFLFSLVSSIWPGFAAVPEYWDRTMEILLNYFQLTTEFQAFFRFPSHPYLIVIVLSLIILVLFNSKKELRWYMSLGVLAVFLLHNHPLKGDYFTMLDTGQGLSTVLSTKDGKGLMFDCGGKLPSGWKMSTLCRLYGVNELNKVFISHANQDHYNLFPQLPGIKTLHVAQSQADAFKTLPGFEQVSFIPSSQGDFFPFGSWRIQVLWPPKVETEVPDLNDSGLVLLVSCEEQRILLMGDAGINPEMQIPIAPGEGPLILQVGHHGSRLSSAEAFLRRTNPALALVASGRKNSFNHPHSDVMERLKRLGIPTLCTQNRGTLCLIVGPGTSELWSGNLSPMPFLKP